MQTEGNIFFWSQKDLAHGTTALVQCPEVDGVNAILIHSLALILPYLQHGCTDGNAVKPCVSACCTWRFPKRQKSFNPQGWPNYSLHKIQWKRGQTWLDDVSAALYLQPLSCCAGLQKTSLVLSKGQADLRSPHSCTFTSMPKACRAVQILWYVVLLW